MIAPEIGETSEEGVLQFLRDHYPQVTIPAEGNPQREPLLREARNLMETVLVGGLGITGRNLSEIEADLPGIRERLRQERGKIVLIGNGLSSLPGEIVNMGEEGHSPEVVVVDMVNYPGLETDIDNLTLLISQQRIAIPPRLEMAKQLVKGINTLAKENRIKVVQHFFGAGEVPVEAQEAQLAINSAGPPKQTLDQQIELLAKGGQLYYSGDIGDFNHPSIKTEKINPEESKTGYILTKIT